MMATIALVCAVGRRGPFRYRSQGSARRRGFCHGREFIKVDEGFRNKRERLDGRGKRGKHIKLNRNYCTIN